jgi:hypothetical protein
VEKYQQQPPKITAHNGGVLLGFWGGSVGFLGGFCWVLGGGCWKYPIKPTEIQLLPKLLNVLTC